MVVTFVKGQVAVVIGDNPRDVNALAEVPISAFLKRVSISRLVSDVSKDSTISYYRHSVSERSVTTFLLTTTTLSSHFALKIYLSYTTLSGVSAGEVCLLNLISLLTTAFVFKVEDLISSLSKI